MSFVADTTIRPSLDGQMRNYSTLNRLPGSCHSRCAVSLGQRCSTSGLENMETDVVTRLIQEAFPLQPIPKMTLHQAQLADQTMTRKIPEQEWIDAGKLDTWPPLGPAFLADVFERARMVLLERTPFPPVSQFGLPEFAAHERRAFDAITFKNTFFVVNGRLTLRLQFHELVHVVQWARLGADKFLLAYGFGLLHYGYEQSPLEKMAYALEEQFVRGQLPRDLIRVIDEGSDAIWNQAAPVVGTPAP
jgi:hypothetical protein